tara:strand:+ start:35865 stop:36143 length:279 start_codon:yes stop_codon:yes gene_type:complete
MKVHTWMIRESIVITSERDETSGGRSMGLYLGDLLLMTSVARDELGAVENVCKTLNSLCHEARAVLNNHCGLIFTRALEPSTLEELAPLVQP